MQRVELECPPRLKPKQCATQWIVENGNGEPTLVKVNNKQNIARNHVNIISREYFYLFKDSKLLLGHVPGMDRLYTDNSFESMIFLSQFKKQRPKRLQKILEAKEQLRGGEGL